jgi:hypothetical protein
MCLSVTCIEQRISLAKVLPSELILAFETEWNWIAYLLQYSTAANSQYPKILLGLFASQEGNRDYLVGWFTESHANVMENLSSKYWMLEDIS